MTIWIASVLRGLQLRVVFPCPVVADNQSALATACVPETKSSRHIHLREHWIRDVLELGDLVLGFIPGPLNAANVGTKILATTVQEVEQLVPAWRSRRDVPRSDSTDIT
jgi:hypothetical protein